MTAMLDADDYADVMVTVAHPQGDIETSLPEWIRVGPGPRRYVEIIAARRQSTGEVVPMEEIPLEYHNSPQARRLQRQGVLPAPWGPPPEREPKDR